MNAVKFLRTIGAPRVLVAIHPETHEIAAGTFNTVAKTTAWLDRWTTCRNCYFTVNRTKRPMTKKPKKQDMAWMDFAHAELDPPKAVRSSPEWRQRARDKLDTLPYPPSIIWDSGNGTQALWRLKSPIRLIDAEAIARCEAANRGLLDALHDDEIEVQGTHNIERLLRIPDTVNYPDKVKRKAGRKIVRAGKVECHPERTYELDALPKVTLIEKPAIDRAIGAPVAIDDLSDLPAADWVKRLIEHCNDDGEYKSRSEAEFAVVCQMIHDRVSDEIILGVLLNPRWRISERVLERGERAQSYAVREIVNAHKKIATELRAEFGPEPRSLDELLSEMFDGIAD